MATVITKQSWGFSDSRGDLAKVGIYIAYDGAVATAPADAESVASAVYTQLALLSNAALATLSGPMGGQVSPRPYGASAQYAPAATKLRFRWQAADGSLHTLLIPSPKLSAFEADQRTALGSALAALVTAMSTAVNSAKVTTRGGSLFARSVGGQLQLKGAFRKMTIYQKSSNLDEPAE